MIVRPYGDRAVLVETDDVLGLRESVLELPGVEEVVPAAATLLIRFDPARFDPSGVAALRPRPATERGEPEPIELPVHYDGADLTLIADAAGWSVEAVVAAHSAATYTVAFCGFAPGFAYLTGLAPALQQPRLESPRTSVPAGSVGIAGRFTGAYPRASPGGWRLLGRTDVPLWDLTRSPPARLTPGARVRFVPA